MKKVRVTDIATLAGVSPTTVSRVLNKSGYVASEVHDRVMSAVAETSYVHIGRKTVASSTNIIGLIGQQGVINPQFANMAVTLLNEVEKKGYYGIQVNAPELNNTALIYHAKRLSELGACGLVVSNFNSERLSDESRILLTDLHIPVVFCERTEGCHEFNRVLVDNEFGAFSATKHLLSKGHTHLAYIYLDKKNNREVEVLRKNGFVNAVSQYGSRSVVYHLLPCTVNTARASAQSVEELYQKDPCVTGILAWNDVFAAGALHYVEKIGKNVPADIEIIGFDDILASELPTPISSVRIPLQEIAEAAIDMICKHHAVDKWPTPRTITLEPKLKLR